MHENASKRTFLNVGPLDSLSPQSDPFEIVEEIEGCIANCMVGSSTRVAAALKDQRENTTQHA